MDFRFVWDFRKLRGNGSGYVGFFVGGVKFDLYYVSVGINVKYKRGDDDDEDIERELREKVFLIFLDFFFGMMF